MIDYKELFSVPYLTKGYQEVVQGADKNPFHNFFAKAMEDMPGNPVRLVVESGSKKMARIVPDGAPSNSMELAGGQVNDLHMISSFESALIPNSALKSCGMRDDGSLDPRGKQILQSNFLKAGRKTRMLRAGVLSKILFDGICYVNPSGYVLESSSGATQTIDAKANANNLGNCNSLIDAAWSTAGTKILRQLETLQDAAEAANGDRPTEVWCNSVMKQYLRANTEVAAYFGSANGFNAAFAANNADPDVPVNIGGFNFHFSTTTYEAADGTTKPCIPTTKILFCPPVEVGGWFAYFNGNEWIPSDMGVFGEDGGNASEVYGDFCFGVPNLDPLGVKLLFGTHFVMGLRSPASVFSATVA